MKNKRTSDQRSEIQRSDLLRSLTIPRLIALETMSQDLVRRGKPASSVQPHVWSEQLFRRLPILGLRSQRELLRGRYLSPNKEMYEGRNALFDPLQKMTGTRSICEKRAIRRKQLFMIGVAGRRSKRSPGSGGHYKRNVESQYSCRIFRR